MKSAVAIVASSGLAGAVFADSGDTGSSRDEKKKHIKGIIARMKYDSDWDEAIVEDELREFLGCGNYSIRVHDCAIRESFMVDKSCLERVNELSSDCIRGARDAFAAFDVPYGKGGASYTWNFNNDSISCGPYKFLITS